MNVEDLRVVRLNRDGSVIVNDSASRNMETQIRLVLLPTSPGRTVDELYFAISRKIITQLKVQVSVPFEEMGLVKC